MQRHFITIIATFACAWAILYGTFTALAQEQAPGVAYEAEPVQFRGVFLPDDAIEYTVTITNNGTETCNRTLQWQVIDYIGARRTTGQAAFELAAGKSETRKIRISDAMPRGWYAIRFETVEQPAEAFDRYFICMEKAAEKDRKASRFGMNTHGIDESDQDFALLARTGAGWLRGLTLWHFVQGSNEKPWQKKPYNWKHPDRMIALSEKQGLQRMGAFFASIAWASSTDPNYKNWWGQSLYPPDDLSPDGPYATYVGKLVERYKDRIQYWEHWNEPNGGFWKGTPAQYVQCLKAAYDAAKAADPSAKVLNGGYAGNALGNVIKFTENGVGKYHDILAIHGYNSPLTKILPFKRVYKRAGIWPVPVWNTETGKAPPLEENQSFHRKMPWYRDQANLMVRTFATSFANNVERVFWFCYAWEPYAMYTRLGPRPAAITYRVLSDVLDTPTPARYVGRFEPGSQMKGVFVFVFERKDGAAVIAWRDALPKKSEGGADIPQFAIPLDDGAKAKIFGVDGRPLPAQIENDNLIVSLGDEATLIQISGKVKKLMKLLGWTRRYPDNVKASVEFTADGPNENALYAAVEHSSLLVNGKYCAATDKKEGKSDNGRFYFVMTMPNDLIREMCDEFGVPHKPVKLRITYLDNGIRPFGIQYAESTATVQRTGSGEWKTKTIDLPNAGFPNMLCFCTFRLVSWGWNGDEAKDIYIHKIELLTAE